MFIFQYGHAEMNHLKSRCDTLGTAIEKIGVIQRKTQPDIFTALIHSIISQQISAKAAASIWERFVTQCGTVTPTILAAADITAIRSCGISERKVIYMQEIAKKTLDGTLNLSVLPSLPDDDVRQELVKLKGIGEWTAEMLMIFSMQRPNILSFGDLAIHRGIRMLYRHRTVTDKLFQKYQRRFSPYCSVASLYLWEIAGGILPELTDPATKSTKPKG